MRILVVAATPAEIAPLVSQLRPAGPSGVRIVPYASSRHDIDVLLTGVGMVATAVWCARTLTEKSYDLALNFGVCGAFDSAIPLAAVVHVVSDELSELGVEDGEAFVSMQDLQLIGRDEPPFHGGRLLNQAPPSNTVVAALPAVRGITVNTVHGRERTIDEVVARCAPEVESMEGGAFMYAALASGVAFAQIRAVSNMVERRSRSGWKLTEAIAALNDTARRVLEAA